MPPHPAVAQGPGDSTPAAVVRTELFDATDTAALGILDQPADRVVLLPFDLGLVCEPSIRRRPPQDPTPGPPVVVVTLDPNAKSMREHGFRSFRTGLLRPDWSREGYTRAVSEALAFIAAGDCYQVNLSHRLSTDFAEVRGPSTPYFAGPLLRPTQGPRS